ncbi:MAG: glycosyltransferase family 39 protein [Verrucomicrobia bacterium]|nr:glycosyltransferase family 39 protein [Verrucomicrobiota bacterium]
MSFSFNSPSTAPDFRLTPFRAYVCISLLWAGIYLSGLGTLQLQHEEPRRALPGLHMLASGDWLVPRVGSDPYLRKPPLLNWAIALSCKLSGGVSEWAVRLPSVLATFALAITVLVIGGRRWLGQEGGLIAAIFFLVNLTMIESGRLAELEAMYVSVTGIALVLWMTSWREEAGSTQLWLFPAPFLALGMLTKGPTHLIFYYGAILPVLFFGKNVRSLLHPAHLLSLVLIVGALLCWAVPCSLAVSGHNPIGVWRFWWEQLASRASPESDEHFRLATWLLNGPQTLKNFLPWTLMLPLLWRKETLAVITACSRSRPRDLALFRGARWGMVATTILMVLLPNGSPRYIYPLIVVPCLLLGRALTVDNGSSIPDWIAPVWRRINGLLLAVVSLGIAAMPFFARADWWILLWTIIGAAVAAALWPFVVPKRGHSSSIPLARSGDLVAQAIVSGAVTALAMMVFATIVMPRIDSANKLRSREVAGAIRAALPIGMQLWVLEDSYRPFWYYLEPEVRYFHGIADLPAQADYILLPVTRAKAFVQNPAWQNAPPRLIMQVVDNENRAFDLFARTSGSQNPG